MAKEKKLPVQKVVEKAKDNVETVASTAKKNKKKITSATDETGAGTTLLG